MHPGGSFQTKSACSAIDDHELEVVAVYFDWHDA